MPSPRSFARKISSLMSRNKSDSSSSHNLLSMKVSENAKPLQVRRGHIPIYVGDDRRRYEVPVKMLKFPALQELLKQSEDYDFDSKIDGPLVIASCPPHTFDQLLKRAANFQITFG